MTPSHMTAEPVALSVLDDTPDDCLMQLISAGGVGAFDTLYQRYAPRWRHYLHAQLGQAELADEVCQDVLLAVWQQTSEFRYASKPSTWVFGIAWHLVCQARTREARRRSEMIADTRRALISVRDWLKGFSGSPRTFPSSVCSMRISATSGPFPMPR